MLPGAGAPFLAAGVVPLPAAAFGAGFAGAFVGLAATGFLGGILYNTTKSFEVFTFQNPPFVNITGSHLTILKEEEFSLVKIILKNISYIYWVDFTYAYILFSPLEDKAIVD